MPRTPRVDVGGIVYHVLNRATARQKIFETDADYRAFERALGESKEQYPMRLLVYCVMPNHWHLVLYPMEDGELVPFMRWLTMTHTQRWHAAHHTAGTGHLYQGRYKSFPIETDTHFLQVVRYVERNALRAGLVRRAEEWPWSSLHRRISSHAADQVLLSSWPVDPPDDYVVWVNTPQSEQEVEAIRLSIARGRPFGGERWSDAMTERLSLQSAFRHRGRPAGEKRS
jgi:putative transposase